MYTTHSFLRMSFDLQNTFPNTTITTNNMLHNCIIINPDIYKLTIVEKVCEKVEMLLQMLMLN